MWIDAPPAVCHPLVEQDPDPDTGQPRPVVPDLEVSVDVFPLRPDLLDACAAWIGGLVVHVNQLPAVLLPGGQGVAGLGDYVVRYGNGAVTRELPGGFDQRFAIAPTSPEES